jgi:hypothetical protein
MFELWRGRLCGEVVYRRVDGFLGASIGWREWKEKIMVEVGEKWCRLRIEDRKVTLGEGCKLELDRR